MVGVDGIYGKDVKASDDYDPDWEEREEEPCSCGVYCYECLGLSWDDFIYP